MSVLTDLRRPADIEYGTRTYAVLRNDEGRILNPADGYWHATTREARRYRKGI